VSTDHVEFHLAQNHHSPFKELQISVLPFHLSKLLVISNQYQSVVMLQHGHHIPVVSLTIVELPSITVSYLLVIPLNIGSSKTHGVLHGEKMVISDLPEDKIHVVSVTKLVFHRDHHLSDLTVILYIFFYE